MKDSKKITATGSRLDSLLGGMVDNKVDNKGFEKLIEDKVEENKIKTGVITKYYQYIDKAEVKLDKTGELVLCKILHRYGGDMIDFYTPLAFEQTFCDKLKEPCVIPKVEQNVCVLQIDDADSKENLILGYYQNKEILGFNPASPGNLKITSITEPNVFWIKFGKDGLDLRLPNRPTEQVGNVEENMKDVETYTKSEIDNLLSEIRRVGVDSGDKFSYKELLEIIEDYKQISSNKYYLFRGDCWTIGFDYEASVSITSVDYDDMKVIGTFRTQNDVVKLNWYSNDVITHPYISYGEWKDYSNVVLEFDYRMSGCKDFKDSENFMNMEIVTNHGEVYYLDMSRFISVVNNVNHFKLDFENLMGEVGDKYLDSKGQEIEWIDGDDLKIPVNDISSISFLIVPLNYIMNVSQHTIMANVDFSCEIFNINVVNGDICNEYIDLPQHSYRLCENYDDVYYLNPKRIVNEMRKLGYVEWCDLYIGSRYYYEKEGVSGDVITVNNNGLDVFNSVRTEKMKLVSDIPLNKAFNAWLGCYLEELKKNDFVNIIISVSMENLQCPEEWRQKQYSPTVSTSIISNSEGFAILNEEPSPYFYSPCNDDALSYMCSVCEKCLDKVVEKGFQPILKLQDLLWRWNKDTNPNKRCPCFYDLKTKEKYRNEFGQEMPIYQTPDDDFDNVTMDWLNKQMVNYGLGLREIVKKSKYNKGLYVILFSPTVLDTDVVPLMMRRVNYLVGLYNPTYLDILQLQDYDWVTGSSTQFKHHKEVYSEGKSLGFTNEHLHYYGGFVENPDNAVENWREINNAMNEAIQLGFKEIFVYGGAEVRRDNKIIGYDKYEMVQQLLYL